MQRWQPWLVPVLSVEAAIGISIWAVLTGRSSVLDACVLVSSVLWVWLSAKASLWNFPVGLINATVTLASLFYQKIYADSALYGLYFILMAYGWWQWRQGSNTEERPIQNVERSELAVVFGASIVLWATAFLILRKLAGYSPIFDGLGFASSLGAQYLLSRKFIENWIGWMFVNSLYATLFFIRGNLLFVLVSLIFLAMSFVGWKSWLEIQKTQQLTTNN